MRKRGTEVKMRKQRGKGEGNDAERKPPLSLPSRLLVWPRFSFRAAVSSTIWTTSLEHTKRQPARPVTSLVHLLPNKTSSKLQLTRRQHDKSLWLSLFLIFGHNHYLQWSQLYSFYDGMLKLSLIKLLQCHVLVAKCGCGKLVLSLTVKNKNTMLEKQRR